MGFKSLVTYNGKAFDLPLVETRFALHRAPCPLRGLPHLDFLFSARSLWKHKYDSCRLFNLAREIVQAERSEDIPGAEIPLRYFQYIRSGDFSLIDPILYHNQEDLLSLLGVVVAGAVLVERNREAAERGEADAMDLFGVAKLFERAGDAATSAALLEKALSGGRGLTAEVTHVARKKLSHHFKRNKDWDKALPFWQEMAAGEDVECFRELSMYFEHTAKDYAEAVRVATEGLALSKGKSLAAERDFEKRIARIKGKMAKGQGERAAMKAMVLGAVKPVEQSPLELRDVPVPEVGPEDILIKVRCCGVCHTDLHIVTGELPAHRMPVVPGHEVVGTVERAGERAGRFAVGQRVGAAWLRSTCGECRFCLSGRENLCEKARFNGYDADGGYAEFMAVPEKFAYADPRPFRRRGGRAAAVRRDRRIPGPRPQRDRAGRDAGDVRLRRLGPHRPPDREAPGGAGLRLHAERRASGDGPGARRGLGRDGQGRAARPS